MVKLVFVDFIWDFVVFIWGLFGGGVFLVKFGEVVVSFGEIICWELWMVREVFWYLIVLKKKKSVFVIGWN